MKRGFNLTCLSCGAENNIYVDLEDVLGESAINCGSCEENCSITDIEAKLVGWAEAIAWLKTAPENKG